MRRLTSSIHMVSMETVITMGGYWKYESLLTENKQNIVLTINICII